jgi:RNA polymerase sigma factor (sigma-70 family)
MTAVDRSPVGPGWTGEAAAENPDVAAEDRALLVRLRDGEDRAFGELFARHSPAVRRLAYGLVHDRSEAEDLTAEAFFRVLQAIRRGAGPVDNVRAYLLIVARRVAWEWRTRRRDVPVSDEELTHRVGADQDAMGQSTERNLITRAFTSLPERWRSVLWKVEVEGERPAVVANNFGLSPNATAALARRARQGLRAAYLQAHLAADRSGAGCRSVLEKLGAYTAGSIKGGERRRIRAHLVGCSSCTAMHAELREVCSGLRAHAALLAAPLAAVAGWKLASSGAAAVKSLLASAKAQVALVASSATMIGVLGLVAGPWGSDDRSVAIDDLDGRGDAELVITGAPSSEEPELIDPTWGRLSTSAVVPAKRRAAGDGPEEGAPAQSDPNQDTPAVEVRQSTSTGTSQPDRSLSSSGSSTSSSSSSSGAGVDGGGGDPSTEPSGGVGLTSSDDGGRTDEPPSESVQPTESGQPTKSNSPSPPTTSENAVKPTNSHNTGRVTS